MITFAFLSAELEVQVSQYHKGHYSCLRSSWHLEITSSFKSNFVEAQISSGEVPSLLDALQNQI